MSRVIVIGAGASGLLAAGRAAGQGVETLVLEKMDRPGRKLCITGKGRCNLTNTALVEEFVERFGRQGRFLRSAFSKLDNEALRDFLDGLGVPTVVERGGRVFPESNDAREVVEALKRWALGCGAAIRTRSAVEQLVIDQGRVNGVEVRSGASGEAKAELLPADAVVLAAGGSSYPATGSTGDGCRLAERAGHTVVPVRPGLVPLETEGDIAPRLQGLSLRNVRLTLFVEGQKKQAAFGELLFTHFGLSGPIGLTLSGQAVDGLRQGRRVTCSIDLKPALDEQKLDARLIRDFDEHGRQKLKNVLGGLLPARLIPVCLERTGLPGERKANQLSAAERTTLRCWLKDFRLQITGCRSFDEAIITQGGVSLKEVDPGTMQSKLVGGLYFAGEVLDLAADTGGFNLQAAFSTGWVAGTAAGRSLAESPASARRSRPI